MENVIKSVTLVALVALTGLGCAQNSDELKDVEEGYRRSLEAFRDEGTASGMAELDSFAKTHPNSVYADDAEAIILSVK